MDRDGVINKLPPKFPNDGIGDIRNYITKWEDFEFLPGAIEAFKLLGPTQWIPIIISNQGGAIGRKLVDHDSVENIFNRMVMVLLSDQSGIIKPDYYFCPHLISDRCACIKPNPGMLVQAAIEHDIVLEDSWMIGDSESDIHAGYNAKIRKMVKIENNTGFYGTNPSYFPGAKILIRPSLLEAVQYILSTEGEINNGS